MPPPSGTARRRLDVSDRAVAGEEPQGLEKHPWLRHDSRDRPWLYKEVVPRPSRPLSDDLVEKIASEIATAVGIPAARVDLVLRRSANGCIVETLRPSRWDIYAGQVPLAAMVATYNPKDPERKGHSPYNLRRVLEGFGPPPDFEAQPDLEAFDVFAGYLLFDALIANTDRHDRNWAVLVPPPGDEGLNRLCGSYDHASSLGFNLSDAQRTEVLAHASMARYAGRAVARQFEHTHGAPRRSLLDIAVEAVHLRAPVTRRHWRSAFSSVGDGELEAIVDRAPDLTDTTRRFTIELLATNRRRILDVLT